MSARLHAHRIAAAAVCTLALTAGAGGAGAATPVPSADVVGAAVPTHTYRADVDGDGRRDSVTVGQASKQRLRVHVRTARGASATLYIPQGDFADWAPQKPYQGAAAFDGVRGQELFILYGMGAHTPWLKVVTWRDGRLYASRNPATGSTDWTPDGAYGYGTGYTVSGPSSSRRLTVTDATRSGSGYSGRQTRFAWSTNRWVRTGGSAVRFSDAASGRYFGWHVPGIPVWPDL